MRKADIKVGEEYAVSDQADVFGWGGPPARVRVTGEPYKRNMYLNEYVVPFVYIREDGTEALGRARQSRDFKMTWADYLAAKAVRDVERAQRQAEIDAERRAQNSAYESVKDVLERAAVVKHDYQWGTLANGTGGLSLAPTDLARLVSCARDGSLDYREAASA